MKLKSNKYTRIIPVLLFKDGRIVKSTNFDFHQSVGNPFVQVERYNQWNLDELIYLNISDNKKDFYFNLDYSTTSSTASKKNKKIQKINVLHFVKKLSYFCRMPLTFGGGIQSVEMARKILKSGADKISLNTAAFKNPKLIRDCSIEFGSQSVVISIDVKKIKGQYLVFIENGSLNTKVKINEWIKIVQEMGAGEVLINSIDHDGIGKGFDFSLCSQILKNSNIPIIIMGGAGHSSHFSKIIKELNPSAVAAANIFQFTENSYYEIKQHLIKKKIKIRNYN